MELHNSDFYQSQKPTRKLTGFLYSNFFVPFTFANFQIKRMVTPLLLFQLAFKLIYAF